MKDYLINWNNLKLSLKYGKSFNFSFQLKIILPIHNPETNRSYLWLVNSKHHQGRKEVRRFRWRNQFVSLINDPKKIKAYAIHSFWKVSAMHEVDLTGEIYASEVSFLKPFLKSWAADCRRNTHRSLKSYLRSCEHNCRQRLMCKWTCTRSGIGFHVFSFLYVIFPSFGWS